jgi:hypothetical protein
VILSSQERIIRATNAGDENRLASELSRFQIRCDVQREILYAVINKTLFSALALQQCVLSAANFPFPCFSEDVVVGICNASNRHSMGFQISEKIIDEQLVGMLIQQKRILCSLLSLRFGERKHRAFIPEPAAVSFNGLVGQKRPLVAPSLDHPAPVLHTQILYPAEGSSASDSQSPASPRGLDGKN